MRWSGRWKWPRPLVTRELDRGAEVALSVAGDFLPAGSGEGHRHAALRILALLQPGGSAPPHPDPEASVLEVRA